MKISAQLLSLMNGAFLLFSITLVVWVALKARRAKRLQDQLIAALDPDAGDAWFRVNVSRPAQFARLLKLLAFEARGILVNSADHVRILAVLPSGERIDRSFIKHELGLRWVGNAGLASFNLHWIGIGPVDGGLMVSADTGFNALQSREATADICRIIDPRFRLPGVALSEFALEKNPASLLAVLAFFGLLAFTFFDGVVWNQNELLEFGKAAWGTVAAPLLALPVYAGLARRRVPSRESMTLAALIGLGVAGAYIPAIKRLDQWMAAGGAVPVAYRLGPNASLEPVSPGPPKINYSSRKEYWQQFKEGSIHHFDLTHGPLGLWQLDHTKLDGELKKFYEASQKDGKSAK